MCVGGDNAEKSWFPTYLFDMSGQPVVQLACTAIELD